MMKTTRRQLLGGFTALAGTYGLGVATPRIISYVEKARFRRAMGAVLPLRPISIGFDIDRPIANLVEASAK